MKLRGRIRAKHTKGQGFFSAVLDAGARHEAGRSEACGKSEPALVVKYTGQAQNNFYH